MQTATSMTIYTIGRPCRLERLVQIPTSTMECREAAIAALQKLHMGPRILSKGGSGLWHFPSSAGESREWCASYRLEILVVEKGIAVHGDIGIATRYAAAVDGYIRIHHRLGGEYRKIRVGTVEFWHGREAPLMIVGCVRIILSCWRYTACFKPDG